MFAIALDRIKRGGYLTQRGKLIPTHLMTTNFSRLHKFYILKKIQHFNLN